MMERRIRMNFAVAPGTLRESSAFRAAKYALALVPLAYFVWFAWNYWAVNEAIYEANDKITAEQDRISKNEREMKNVLVRISTQTAEVSVTPDLRDAVARTRSEIGQALRKRRTDESAMLGDIAAAAAGSKVSWLEVGFREKKASFAADCSSEAELSAFCARLSKVRWIDRVFVTRQSISPSGASARLSVEMKEGEILE